MTGWRAWSVAALVLAACFITPAGAAEPFSYTVRLEGLTDKRAGNLFNDLSLLKQQKAARPRSLAELRGRARGDVKALEKILRGRGYYLSRVSYRLMRNGSGDDYAVAILVDQGPRYQWTALNIRWAMPDDAVMLQAEADKLAPKLPRPMTNSAVLELERALLARLPEMGYPVPRVNKRDVVVDHATREVRVTFELAEGPRQTFGPLEVSGLATVRPGYLRRLTPWREGDPYDVRLMDEYRAELLRTGLFSALEVSTDPAAGGDAPVRVMVREGPHRSYGAGAAYSTSEGFGGNVFWQHRNFFHRGERFGVAATAAEQEQSIAASLDVNAFRRRDQRLLADVKLTREDPDAFTRYAAEAAAGIERPLSDHWTALVGGAVEYTNVRDADGRRNFYLLGGRGALRWDNTDSLLDPRRGQRLFVSARPYVGQQSGTLQFTVLETTASVYWPLDDARRYVLAARARLGAVVGAALDRLPADKRFYAGGGNSVRGYRYQLAGPLDAQDKPVGGRSLVEAGVEARLRVTERIGVVPFVEMGRVNKDSLPDFSEKLFWGAGLGVRYHTDFAPIRLDVAFPLNKRRQDNAFQIYISLGQSF